MRPGLIACRCGSTDLHLHRYWMGAGANVWCRSCKAGTPAGKFEDLEALVHHERHPSETGDTVDDATPGAIAKWNTWTQAEPCKDAKP